ncbi:MAG: cobT [Firmicutes bacterium]|nr:cobT [Bacillota bacterium]
MNTIVKMINTIQPLDAQASAMVRQRFDSLIKPRGSLGILEEMTAQTAGIRQAAPLFLLNKTIIHVAAQQGLPAPSFISSPAITTVLLPLLQQDQLKDGTVLQLIRQGIAAASLQIDQGAEMLGISQDAITDKSVQSLAGELLMMQGQGKEALDKLVCLLERCENHPVAVLLGIILTGAARRVPVVLDGLATACAALAACRLNSNSGGYTIGVYLSSYPEHEQIFAMLGHKPGLPLRLSVGSGIGTILTLSLLDAGIKALTEMGTFDGAGVSAALQDLPQRQDY